MERMTVQDYEKGLVSGKTLQGEILESLSPFEKTLVRRGKLKFETKKLTASK